MSGNDRYDSGARPYDLPGEPVAYGAPAPVYGTPPPARPVSDGPAVPPIAWATVRSDQVMPSGATVVVAWLVVVLTGFYLLPWAIAATRGKGDRWSIFWVTLLLGWTGIGWLICLVWSVLPHHLVRIAPLPAPAGWYPSPDGSLAYWDGARWTGHRA